MTTLADIAVHNLTNSPWLRLPISAIDVVHHGAENSRVGHLPADEAEFHILAAQKFLHLFFHHALDLANKLRALVIKDFGVVECLGLLMFAIAKRRVHDRQQPGHGRDRHL